MTIAKAITRAWTDAAYKARLLSDPLAALAEAGVKVPAGATVKMVENTADTSHLVLPVAPGNAGELSIEELEKVTGRLHSQSSNYRLKPFARKPACRPVG